MIKCEFINRMIAIPQCIWNNFTGTDDFCCWVTYDDSKKIEEAPGHRKIFEESYGYEKLGFFNYQRGDVLTFEWADGRWHGERIPTDEEKEAIRALAKERHFIDYTDEEKENIKTNLADHPAGHSLNCGPGWFGHINEDKL